jgi:hypothetical protein
VTIHHRFEWLGGVINLVLLWLSVSFLSRISHVEVLFVQVFIAIAHHVAADEYAAYRFLYVGYRISVYQFLVFYGLRQYNSEALSMVLLQGTRGRVLYLMLAETFARFFGWVLVVAFMVVGVVPGRVATFVVGAMALHAHLVLIQVANWIRHRRLGLAAG